MGKIDGTQSAGQGLLDPIRLLQVANLLKVAETDQRAAVTLNDARLYPQAVFSLQQAVEKTVKAIGLSTMIISPSELQSAISHKAINVFLVSMRKMLAFTNAQTADQKAIAMLDEWLRVGENAKDRFGSTARPTAGELDQWIAAHRSLRDEIQDVATSPSGARLIEAAREAVTTPLPFDAADIPKRLFELVIVIAGLYFLCLATLAHAVASRYGEGSRTPLDIYTDAHPLVARLRDLNDIASECIAFAQSALSFVLSWVDK